MTGQNPAPRRDVVPRRTDSDPHQQTINTTTDGRWRSQPFRTFGETVRLRLPLVVVVFVLLAVCAIAVARGWPMTYKAAALVSLEADAAAQFGVVARPEGLARDPTSLRSQMTIAASPPVLESAVAALSDALQSPWQVDDLAERLTVDQIEGSRVLSIAVTHHEPREAAQAANAVADAYLEFLTQSDLAALDAMISRMTDALQLLADDIAQRDNVGDSPERDAEIASMRERLGAFFDERERLIAALSTVMPPATIVAPAMPPAAPSFPNRLHLAVAGLLVAAFAAVGIGALREATDGRLHRRDDVRRLTGHRLFGSLPRASRHPPGVDGQDPEAARTFQAIALGGVPHRAVSQRSLLSIAVVPVDSHADAAAISDDLAAFLSFSNGRTVLIDADCAEPIQSSSSAARFGLTDVLASPGLLGSSDQWQSRQGKVSFVGTGQRNVLPASAVHEGVVERLLDEVASDHEAAVIRCAPLMRSSEGAALARSCRVTAVIATPAVSTWKDIQSTIDQLERAGASNLGLVFARRRHAFTRRTGRRSAATRPAPMLGSGDA